MKYNSIVPSQMTKKELEDMLGELHVAKNWGMTSVEIFLTTSQLGYEVPTVDAEHYQREYNKR